jgi:hypothetical protein
VTEQDEQDYRRREAILAAELACNLLATIVAQHSLLRLRQKARASSPTWRETTLAAPPQLSAFADRS